MDFAGQTAWNQSIALSTELPLQSSTPLQPQVSQPRLASLQLQSPALTSGSLTYQENGTPILIGAGIILSSNPSSVSVSNSSFTPGESSEDWFTIQPGNGFTLNGTDIKLNGQKIGSYRQIKNGFSSTQLIINFESTTPQATKQALIGRIAYSSVADRLASSRERALEFRDGNTLIGTTQVSVQGVNDLPAWGQETVLYRATGTNTPGNSGWLELQQYDGTAVQDPALDGTVLVSNNPANAGYAGYTNYDVDIKRVTLPFPLSGSIDVPYFTQTNSVFNRVNSGFPVLDRTQGYRLNFSLDLRQESGINSDRNGDGNNDRAGFSIVVNSEDLKGIELGFQRVTGVNQEALVKVFAQNDGATQEDPKIYSGSVGPSNLTLFTQAESGIIAYGGLGVYTNFSLVVQGDLYTLFANDNAILSGRLRDYSQTTPVVPRLPLGITLDQALGFAGLTRDQINPYNKKSFLFIGDNTSDAQTLVKLNNITITTNTTPPNTGLTVAEDAIGSLPQLGNWIDLDSTTGTSVVLEATKGKITFDANAFAGSLDSVVGNGTGTVTLTGNFSQLQALARVTGVFSYQGNSNVHGTDTVKVTFSDTSISGLAQTLVRNVPITITATPDIPTNIILSGNQVLNTATVNTKVADLDAIDPDNPNDSFTYTLLNNAGGRFAIVGSELQVAGALGAAGDQTIRVRVTDAAQNNFEKDMLVTVTAPAQSGVNHQVVFQNRGTGELAWWNVKNAQIDQSGGFTLEAGAAFSQLPLDWQLISNQFDFNNDSIEDFVWFNRQTTETVIWYMKVGSQGVPNVIGNNSSFVYAPGSNTAAQPLGNWKLLLTSDLVGDSRPEFLWENTASGETYIWQLNIANDGRVEINANGSGFITFNNTAKTPIATGGVASGWRVLGSGNFDGNSSTKELLWFNTFSTETVIWQLSGRELVNSGSITSGGNPVLPGLFWRPMAIANIDGSGNDEIIWQGGNSIAIWEIGNNFALTPKSTIAIVNLDAGEVIQGLADLEGDNTLEVITRQTISSNDPTRIYYLDNSTFQLRSQNPTKAITLAGQATPVLTGDPRWTVLGVIDFELVV
ncbi:MAG: hypothetical protein VKJ24_19560 [Synechococcales bacterium]|nr:hypothetical protein [Synechococcales bacterium]